MKTRMFTDQEKAFLTAYLALTKEHNMYIDACGCCGSPYLSTSGETPRGLTPGNIENALGMKEE